ncbi:glycoside hydrolase family 16 protein [Paraflavitalea sp. CAU 1676]|uniref:glycoside hydrolase family 16 protein n=1 Tax=Paraflavitalea sp. CAU 1676 TaxID=3032598 RepID=UPI0023DBEB93|nr:glycoside hydrolase family 16 protein [Paraflavitalea sp. CAU 1676]MDF2190631.1 glycoside hydrolase family 16 protein [Paraflavitalea sp. CAU 1676]
MNRRITAANGLLSALPARAIAHRGAALRRVRVVLYITMLCLVASSCKTKQYTIVDNYMQVQTAGRELQPWKLVWQEDFNGKAIDTTKWTRISPNTADWGRHMTTADLCYDLHNGQLYLKGVQNPDTSTDKRPYLTGGVYTKGKFAFQYGMVEIRAKLECAQGAWPAMWLLPEKSDWPRGGEIDIMEHLNFDSIVYQTIHTYYTYTLKKDKEPPHGSTARMKPNDFNVYGIKWFPDKIVYVLNGKETFTYPRVAGVDPSQWPFDKPFYLLIDQQLGGSWVGKVKTAHLPVNMIIDWVRVYQ